ncbi:hypothetical protein Tco_1507542 [Tanacetum coccineum]
MLGIRLRRRVKFGDVIRDNQCLDMDLNRSEITGNLSKRSVLDMTVHTYEGSLLSVMCSSDDALPSSSPVTTSDPTCNSEKVLRIISMEKVKPTKIETVRLCLVGSLVLVGGDPGVGKSTILQVLQAKRVEKNFKPGKRKASIVVTGYAFHSIILQILISLSGASSVSWRRWLGRKTLMEVVVAANCSDRVSTTMVHDGCDGGDFGEVELAMRWWCSYDDDGSGG